MTTQNSPTQSPSWVMKAIFIFFSIIFVLACSVWALSGYLITYKLNQELEVFDLQLADSSSMSFNPFIGALVVRDISLDSVETKEPMLAIKHATIDINLLRLLTSNLSFDELVLEGIYVNIKRDDESILVAGIDKSKVESPEETKQDVNVDTMSHWSADLSNIDANNIHVEFVDFGFDHQLILDQLDVETLVASQTHQQFGVNVIGRINEAKLGATLNGALTNGFGEITTDVSLSDFTFDKLKHYIPAEIERLSGRTGIVTKITTAITPTETSLKTDSLIFSADELVLGAQGTVSSIAQAVIEANELVVTFNQPEGEKSRYANIDDLTVNTAITVGINNVAVKSQQNEETLMSLGQFKVLPVSLVFEQADAKLSTQRVQFDQLIIAKDAKIQYAAVDDAVKRSEPGEAYTLASFNQIALNELNFNADALSISDITFDAINANVILNEERALANLPQFMAQTNQDNEEVQAAGENLEKDVVDATEPEPPTLAFVVNRIVINEPTSIYFRDMSLESHFERDVKINTFELDNLTNAKTERLTFNFAAEVDAHAGLAFTGTAAPWADKVNMSLKANLDELSLPELSAYLGQTANLEFLSGQLDTQIDLNVQDDILTGESGVLLRGVEIADAPDAKSEKESNESMISLGTAFNMLKDSEDNVELEIPLSGDIADPKFGLSSFINIVTKKAVLAATETYLIQTFVPYANIVSVAKIAGGYMLKTDIKPLIYSNGQVALDTEQHQYIDQVAGLMKERPDMHIKVCAFSVNDEIAEPTEDINKALKLLSKQRADYLKQYLMGEQGIDSKRIVLCSPRIDSEKGASPRIEFNV